MTERRTHETCVGKNISLTIENVNLIHSIMQKEQVSFSQALDMIIKQWVLKSNIVSRMEEEAHRAQGEVAMLKAQLGQVSEEMRREKSK